MGHCLICGCNHPTTVCPPENFIILRCNKCGNEDIVPGDVLLTGITHQPCIKCDDTNWKIEKPTLDYLKKKWRNYGKYCSNVRALDLKKVNSATKYPSILTYHNLGEQGRLTEELLVAFNDCDELSFSEKIDGTNSRIILFPDSQYLIGSREDLLHFRGDLIFNSSMKIVETIKSIAENSIRPLWKRLEQSVIVLFGEVYGGKISRNGKNYSKDKTSFRLFDVIIFEAKAFEELLEMPIEAIASWRDNGGQKFLSDSEMLEISNAINCPLVFKIKTQNPPATIKETYEWLKTLLPGKTNVAIEGEGGLPEGIVVRTKNRTKIAKIRFEDYERTLQKKR